MTIGIIGGGASGMAAALAAAENPGVEVILLERQARLGRKLQATGNGRCNLTNLHAGSCGYHGEEPSFAQAALRAYPPEEVLTWFRRMGLFTVAEASGRVYPYSDQANSVTDVLRFALERDNIRVLTGMEVRRAKRSGEGFFVEGAEGGIHCDSLIIACGGLAGTKLGGSMSGYQLLRSFGHHSTRLRPALVQLKTSWPGIRSLKGVRADCRASVLRDDNLIASSRGELQLTEFGLSGPVIYEISRDACQGAGSWSCLLDFLPDVSADQMADELLRRAQTALPASELFTGILHNRLGRVITAEAGISQNISVRDIPTQILRSAAKLAKAFVVPLTEPMGMDSAQVTAGGILTSEFDGSTMESRLVPGLYACGEVLDIDGDCGGFNLQWAWSSGRLAGTSAGRRTQ